MKDYTEIQGWFDFQDYYDRVAAAVPRDGILVELGPWLGKSTVYLAQALLREGKDQATLFAVDTWKGNSYEQELFDYVIRCGTQTAFLRFVHAITTFGLRQIVIPIISDSAAAADWFPNQSLDFVFFDTEHTEACLSRELVAWLPKLKPGAHFGGHDIKVDGVSAAVRKHVPGALNVNGLWWESSC